MLFPSLPPTDTYLALACRVQDAIRSPQAQRLHEVTISRRPCESRQDWQRLLYELGSTTDLRLVSLCDDRVRLCWYIDRS
ncbi:Protein of unknown function [Geopseudomonas sagittaria]|uniref:DUF1654 domain-containing protein n=1 Tax=Geopseudomonas sagittaria TaxID=1135990 RepID=A0A1I5PY83_9GAMM|nr:DUF1654 domain-containing protein [Pseudomonas sagittaria]SFP38819.1 Protein of unknown function [Pseudomonas sagittaria]